MPKNYIIDAGNLNSLENIYAIYDEYLNFISDFEIDREESKFLIDLRHLEKSKINLFSLVSLLAIFHKVSEDLHYPVPLILDWNPYILKFLDRINFFHNARKYGIFWYDDKFLGGYPNDEFNPNSKIYIYPKLIDIPDYLDYGKMESFKEEYRIIFENDLGAKIASLFLIQDKKIIIDFDETIRLLSKVSAELLVNSLVHGQNISVVGLQRSPYRISICLADSGIGFKGSIPKSNSWTQRFKNISDPDFIALGCLIKEKGEGLRQAIDRVIKLNGHVLVSSNEYELKLRNVYWNSLKMKYSRSFLDKNVEHNLNLISKYFILPPEEYQKTGFCQKYITKSVNYFDHSTSQPYSIPITPIEIIGTRISFEIPLKYKNYNNY